MSNLTYVSADDVPLITVVSKEGNYVTFPKDKIVSVSFGDDAPSEIVYTGAHGRCTIFVSPVEAQRVLTELMM